MTSLKRLPAGASIIAVLASILICPTAFAFRDRPESIENRLPDPASIRPWKADGPLKTYRGENLYEYINGGAEIFYEYGFIQLAAQTYRLDDRSITVEIYEMEHPKAAFGIYSVQRNPEMPPLEVGDAGTGSETMVSFCRERFYVLIASGVPDNGAGKAMVRMARAVSRRIGKSSNPPVLIQVLPEPFLISGSEGYVAGLLGLNTRLYLGNSNILGLNGRTVEGVFAEYRNEAHRAEVMAVSYPDASRAARAFNAAARFFRERYKVIDKKDSVFSDEKNGYYRLLSAGKLLYIIGGSDSVDFMKEIAASIRLLNKSG